MPGLDAVGCVQIRSGARHLENAVVRARAERPDRVMAFSNNFSPSAVMAQNLRIMLDDICAFE
jgi:hypothetical protein